MLSKYIKPNALRPAAPAPQEKTVRNKNIDTQGRNEKDSKAAKSAMRSEGGKN
jgi:hypothetical protein